MRACVATGEPRQLEARSIPRPDVGPGWLLLKTRYACVCGSDLEYLDGAFGLVSHQGREIPGFGIVPGSIPGHEFVAEVVDIGEGIDGWAIGDRVVPLGHPDPGGIGPPIVGYENYRCMADYFLSTPEGVQRVPDHVPDNIAVFVEPLSTGNGAVAAADVHPGKSVVVIGAGKIGLLAVMAARAAGAAPVVCVDIVESRLEKAREVGADAALNSTDENFTDALSEHTGNGADAVLICVRDGKVLNLAAEIAAPGAIIVLAGFVAPMEVNPMLWTMKRLRIQGILGGSMVDAMHMVVHGQVDPAPLVSGVYPFEQCQAAIDSVYAGENIAVLMH